jgi:NAD(P)H-binding
MLTTTAIIFGPTGKIGSTAARAAQKHGLKVILAMRDTKKPIPGLSAEQEKEGGYERVEADLTKPDTIEAAVLKSGAKRVIFYLAHGSLDRTGSPDHMRTAITALKSSGIEFCVFISSFTVSAGGDLKSIPRSDLVSYNHGQVELVLKEIFGDRGFVAVRPGAFATNTLRWKAGYGSGELKMVAPEVTMDWIAPVDIGDAAGAILARGPQDFDFPDGESFVDLCGPQLISQGDAAIAVAKAIGYDLIVSDTSDNEGLEMYIKAGVPKPLANYMVRTVRAAADGSYVLYDDDKYLKGVQNVRIYTGREPTKFQDWVDENKGLFI